MHTMVRDKIAEVNLVSGLQYARDVVASYRGTFQQEAFPRLNWCNDLPPSEIHVFSDV